MRYGYARVSTPDQRLYIQMDALIKQGIAPENIYSDKGTGANMDRPGLTELLERLEPGDELVAWKLDRIARSLQGLLVLLDDFEKRGLVLTVDGISTGTSMGRMLFSMLGLVAEFERNLICERNAASRKLRTDRGESGGRPWELSVEQLAQAHEMVSSGRTSISRAARIYKVHRNTMSKSLKRYREMH